MKNPASDRSLAALFVVILAVAHGVSSALGAAVGEQWVPRAQLPTPENLAAIATSDSGTCVVVGDHGTILSSTTGTAWTPRSAGTSLDLQDVIWTGSKFVAVGYFGALLSSTDGISWNVASIVDASFTSVVWTGTQLVAVGGQLTTAGWVGIAYTSPDAVTWTRRPITGAPYLFCAAFKAGLIAAVGNGFVLTSSNGVTWTKRALTPGSVSGNADVISIAATGTEFIVTGSTVWSSGTGNTWLERSDLSPFLTGMKLRWTGGELIATHPNGYVFTSANGFSWADNSAGMAAPPLAGGRLGSALLVAGYGGRIERQTTPGTWTATHTTQLPGSVSGLAHSGSLFVAVSTNLSWTSTDGDTWTQHQLTDTNMHSVVWDGTQFIACGSGAWKSTDGITWTNTIPADSGNGRFFSIAHMLGKTYICGYKADTDSVISAVTTDGTNWAGANMPVPCTGFATNGTLLVGSGWLGEIISSTTGTSWARTAVNLAPGEDFNAIVFAGGQFVAATGYGNIFTSATGATWIFREAVPQAVLSITRTSNEYILVGDHGMVLRSFDGLYWRFVDSFTSHNLFRVLWTGSRLVTTSSHGGIFTSDGTPAVRPTVSLSGFPSALPETGGSALVTATLSSTWPRDVSVPVAFSGASTNGIDYTPSANSILIEAGSISASISITAKSDVLDETDESLLVTALAPTGDVALSGSNFTSSLTITDDDTQPTFGAPMPDQLVVVGTPVVFNAPATGTGVITYQWKKNNAAITGAKLASYSMAKAALTHAGEYFVEAKNLSATVSSSKPKLGVVAPANSTTVVKTGTTGTMLASAAGAVSYVWKRGVNVLTNGGRISGATTGKLVITGLTTDDSDIYTCEVSLGSLTLIASTIDFAVIDNVAVITQPADVITRVAALFDFTPSATQRPTRWTITNLPPGLVFNATTGRITGKPTTVGPRLVKLIATNLYGNSLPVSFTITVEALPAPTLGSFVALLPRDPANAGLGARLDITTTGTGRYTGRLSNGAAVHILDSYLTGQRLTPPTGHIRIVRPTPQPALDLDFSIDINTGILTATVTDGITAPTGTGLAKSAASTNRTGAYNIALSPAAGSPTGAPEGHGYSQFTVSATGAFNAAGKFADSTAYTITTQIAADGSIPFFLPLYAGKGSVSGTLQLHEDAASSYANNFITGAVSWFKSSIGTGRSYATGIPLMTLDADGGRHNIPVKPGIVMNLNPGTGNAKLRFNGGKLNLASRDPDGDFTVAALAVVTKPASNDALTTMVFDTAKGLVSGQFTLSDTDTSVLPNVARLRVVPYYGVLIRPGGLPAMKALGFYNLPEMPVATPVKTTLLTSPMWSGAMSITP